jgi:hypothetical protein
MKSGAAKLNKVGAKSRLCIVLLFAWAAHNVGVGCNAAGFAKAVTSVTAASSERKPPRGRFSSYRFVSGRSIAYRLEYSSVSNADLRVLFQDLDAAKPQQTQSSGLTYALAASLRGQMIATTVTTSPDRVQVLHAFDDIAVDLAVNGAE